jgi:hypothetical protein
MLECLPVCTHLLKKKGQAHTAPFKIVFLYGKAEITVKVPYLKFFMVSPGVYTSGLKKVCSIQKSYFFTGKQKLL